MIRLYARAASIAFISVILVAIIIHAQPYDERAPVAVLRPINCRAPCFMSIRPGITTIDQAIDLLRRNLWVSQVDAIPNELHPNQISWRWNAKAPEFLQRSDTSYDGQILATTDRKVSWIRFNTTLEIGAIPQILGNPQDDAIIVVSAGNIPAPPDPSNSAIVMYWFRPLHLSASVVRSCPLDADFEESISQVMITDYDLYAAVQAAQLVPHPKLMPALRQLSLQACGF